MPYSMPAVLGVKVTEMVQLAVGARVGPQVFVCPKFALAAILAMSRIPVPELVRITGRDWPVMQTASMPKVKLVVDRETSAANNSLLTLQPLSKSNAPRRHAGH